MTFEHSRDLRCVLNSLGECLANVPEACQCMKMPRLVYEEARKKFGDVDGEIGEKK